MYDAMLRFIRPLWLKGVRCLLICSIDKDSSFETPNFVGRFVHLSKTEIGKYTYIGNRCEFSRTKIGSFCSISSNVRVLVGTHPTKSWVSTHPLFFSKRTYLGDGFLLQNRYDEYEYTSGGYYCEIGNDVWIGSNVLIKQGVKIGNGAIIGANSLVLKDVPEYTIVGGSPAQIIRARFNDEDISFLNDIQWWKWSYAKLQKLAPFFDSIDRLKKETL